MLDVSGGDRYENKKLYCDFISKGIVVVQIWVQEGFLKKVVWSLFLKYDCDFLGDTDKGFRV